MALINCPECTREISDKAASCPHCGYPIVNQPSEPGTFENIVEPDSAPKNSQKKNIAIFSVIAVAIIAFIIIIISATDTSGTKPKNMSDEHYNYGKRVLDVVDLYLDNKIDAETAYHRLTYGNLAGNLPETEFGDQNHSNNLSVVLQVSHLDYVLMKHSLGQATLSELIEDRNELAKILNEKTR